MNERLHLELRRVAGSCFKPGAPGQRVCNEAADALSAPALSDEERGRLEEIAVKIERLDPTNDDVCFLRKLASQPAPCVRCNGWGRLPLHEGIRTCPCPRCDGTGRVASRTEPAQPAPVLSGEGVERAALLSVLRHELEAIEDFWAGADNPGEKIAAQSQIKGYSQAIETVEAAIPATDPNDEDQRDEAAGENSPATKSSSQPVLSEREAVEKIRHEAVALEAKGKLKSVDAIPLRDAIAAALSEQPEDCERCGGSGHGFLGGECPDCGATGKKPDRPEQPEGERDG